MKKEIDLLSIDTEFYERTKSNLKKRDGYRHVLVLNSFSAMLTERIACEERFSAQLDDFLVHMQKDGYVLLDVKISPLANSEILGSPSGYCVTIIYQ